MFCMDGEVIAQGRSIVLFVPHEGVGCLSGKSLKMQESSRGKPYIRGGLAVSGEDIVLLHVTSSRLQCSISGVRRPLEWA
jgi:hypothetical protein